MTRVMLECEVQRTDVRTFVGHGRIFRFFLALQSLSARLSKQRSKRLYIHNIFETASIKLTVESRRKL